MLKTEGIQVSKAGFRQETDDKGAAEREEGKGWTFQCDRKGEK